jgi:hypothetical protein
MTDRVKVTITGYYDLPGNMDKRLAGYGTTDPAGCAWSLRHNEPTDLLPFCDDVTMTVELVTEPPGGEEA